MEKQLKTLNDACLKATT